MEILTGVILDLSDSVRQNLVGDVDIKDGEWARSIFDVIDNFVKHDVSTDNYIFAVGVGAKYGEGIFDVIKTIEPFQTSSKQKTQLSYDEILEKFYNLLDKHGARTTRTWASKDVIKKALSIEMAGLILDALNNDSDFLKEFIDNCLPSVCKDIYDIRQEESFLPKLFGELFNAIQNKAIVKASTYSAFKLVKATENDIRFVIGRLFKNVENVFSAKRASEILHGCLDKGKLSSNRISELMEVLAPYIYGDTPMEKALTKVTDIFSNYKYSNYTKLLFVFSDGEQTSRSAQRSNLKEELTLPDSIVKKLKYLNVTVVGCLINRCNIEPQKLFCEEKPEWSNGAKCLFRLSSTLSSQLLPRTVLIKNGWDIETTNNETKLFLLINHPDNINKACKLAKKLVCCHDSLTDLLASVSLDMIINQSTSSFSAKEQEKKTCYANAIAAVFYLSMKRIIGRTGGYPDFYNLREVLIERFGKNGANVDVVLKATTPKYRLQYKSVDVKNAMKAIVAKRPVVAIFSLTDEEWSQFGAFYSVEPKGILTQKIINITDRQTHAKLGGHAVVLTSFNSKCLHFMNSWGVEFADMGFFRVQNSKVLGFEYYDVYWTEDDLKIEEKEFFEAQGTKVGQELMKTLKSLKNAEYTCLECGKMSQVTKYIKWYYKLVKCPECGYLFNYNNWNKDGNMLALCMNMYLTSLYD